MSLWSQPHTVKFPSGSSRNEEGTRFTTPSNKNPITHGRRGGRGGGGGLVNPPNTSGQSLRRRSSSNNNNKDVTITSQVSQCTTVHKPVKLDWCPVTHHTFKKWQTRDPFNRPATTTVYFSFTISCSWQITRCASPQLVPAQLGRQKMKKKNKEKEVKGVGEDDDEETTKKVY